jgi:signal transduction histidine kinase
MQLNRRRVLPEIDNSQAQNIGQLVHDILERYRLQMADKNILLETDFDTVEAFVATSKIQSIVTCLIENALEPMTRGGEISVTLIDGKYQWELEVADSFGMAFGNVDSTTHNADEMLPLIIPFPESQQLRDAHRAAISQGAQIEAWNCPQGGTAHVLTVPRRHKNQNQEMQFSKS